MLSLKYQRFTPSGCKDKEIRNFEFVAKTQFLCLVWIPLNQNKTVFIYKMISVNFEDANNENLISRKNRL